MNDYLKVIILCTLIEAKGNVKLKERKHSSLKKEIYVMYAHKFRNLFVIVN